jgi:hypothetical protein
MIDNSIEYLSHLCDLMNQVSEDDYKDIVVKYAEWYVNNLQDKELEDHYKPYLEKVIYSAFLIDQTIDNMSRHEIRRSYIHSYIVDLLKMKTNELVKEMTDMGYQVPLKEEKPEHIYLLIKLTVDEDTDHEDVVNECDYTFTHDNILGSQILTYRSEQDGESPVLYFP